MLFEYMKRNKLANKQISSIINQDNLVSRRDFLRFGLLSGTVFLTYPNLIFSGPDCEWTTPDMLGPYYVNDAPTRQILIGENEPGTRTIISGAVLGNDCTTPVAGAIIDSWSADDSGCYSAVGPCAAPGDPDRNLRGKMITGMDGRYEFEIVKPGFYQTGNTYRPSHVHFRIVSPDQTIFVTQLYFEGDPYIASDPSASAPQAAKRIIPLAEEEEQLFGTFDIKLDVNVTTDIHDEHYLPDQSYLYQNYPNPFNGSTIIRYSLKEHSSIYLSIHDQGGKLIKNLNSDRKNPGYHQEIWDGTNKHNQTVSSGLYFYRLIINCNSGKYVLTKRLLFIK